MSDDITKIIQAYNTAQEKTGKLIENTISQVLTKAQSIITPGTSIYTGDFGTNYTNCQYEKSWTSAWLTSNHNMSQQPEFNTHQIYRPSEDDIPTQTHINQQQSKPF